MISLQEQIEFDNIYDWNLRESQSNIYLFKPIESEPKSKKKESNIGPNNESTIVNTQSKSK